MRPPSRPSNSETGAISVLMNQSMVLLPRVPMQPRINDYRVGYFNIRSSTTAPKP